MKLERDYKRGRHVEDVGKTRNMWNESGEEELDIQGVAGTKRAEVSKTNYFGKCHDEICCIF